MDNTQNEKNPTVAWLLWLFLGGFGGHRFYMGKVGSGIGMLVLNLASAVLSLVVIGFVGYLALFVWWVVDAFMMNKWLNEGKSAASSFDDASEPPMSHAA